MRGKSEPAMGMIRRTQAIQPPQCFRQSTITECVALAPPLIPDGAEVMVRAALAPRKFVRQQSADAKQSRLTFEDGRLSVCQPAAQFADALHGPDVLFVAESA